MTWVAKFEYHRDEESYEAETLEDLAKRILEDGKLDWDEIRYLDLSKTATTEEEVEFEALFKKMSAEGASMYRETLLHNDTKQLELYLNSALSNFRNEIAYCNSAGIQRAKGRAEDVLKGCFGSLKSKSREELKEKYLKLLKDKLHELAP